MMSSINPLHMQAYQTPQLHVAGGSVLVHCQAGMSRSASVVIGYLMWKNKLPLRDAIALTRKGRPRVLPNAGFLCQLLEFGKLGCNL